MPLPRLALAAALLASAFVNAFAADAVTPSAKTELFNGKVKGSSCTFTG